MLLDTEAQRPTTIGESLVDSTRSVQFMPSLKDVATSQQQLNDFNLGDSGLQEQSQEYNQHLHKSPSIEAQTLNQINADNNKIVTSIRQRAQEQINTLEKERDAIVAQSRDSIGQLQNELESTKKRLLSLQADHSRALQDIEQLKHIYETRQAGISDKLQLTDRENDALKQEIRATREEMRVFQEQQQKSFQERLKIAEQSQRAINAQLAQKVKVLQQQLQQVDADKLNLLKSAAADMCKLNDCIEGQRDRISQLKVLSKQQQAEILILSHEKEVNYEQNKQNIDEIQSLRRRNENLTRELLRVDKMIYGKYKK
eukprot:EST46184.1 hypothetical protein SS50377_13779 [Spironucleus salmonicida]